MNILLLGGGGREHALAWKLKQSSHCEKLFIAPGNAGTAGVGINRSIGVNEFDKLAALCMEENVEMVVVGPEDPLVNGIYDHFANDPSLKHINVIGPSAKAAQLEGSKAFAKEFMIRHGIPTAKYREFTPGNYSEGVTYIKEHSVPVVLKADGLAAGKGVLICQNSMEAMAEFELMLQQSKFGEAGKKVVVEEFLEGIEMSCFVLTDGNDYVLLPEAKDYKRIGEGDTGLNTGGMGAVSPVPFFDEILKHKIITRIVEPTIRGLSRDGLVYKGFVFIGLMITNGEPFVIEYNCRMGDPETEVVIPRLKNDLVELLSSLSDGRLKEQVIDTDSRAAATVVAVSGGYPGSFEKGKEITGLEKIRGSLVFHAGTVEEDGAVKTNGGRVLAVTSFGDDVAGAAITSVNALQNVQYEDIYFRKDISHEFRDPL